MKKGNKNNKRNFKQKTLLADTKEDKVSNRNIYERHSSSEEEQDSNSNNFEEGYSSDDEKEIEPVEITRKNFDIKLTMIVKHNNIEFQSM